MKHLKVYILRGSRSSFSQNVAGILGEGLSQIDEDGSITYEPISFYQWTEPFSYIVNRVESSMPYIKRRFANEDELGSWDSDSNYPETESMIIVCHETNLVAVDELTEVIGRVLDRNQFTIIDLTCKGDVIYGSNAVAVREFKKFNEELYV